MNFDRARYFDPGAGRFLSRNPIGFAGGDVNLYRYLWNNPLNWVDPEGLSAVGWIIKLGNRGYKIIEPLFSTAEARFARKQGKDILCKNRQTAKAVEKGAFGGGDVLRHKGHTLPDGSKGRPHFQTPGQPGYTFWSIIAFIVGSLDPFEAISGELSPEDTLDYLDPNAIGQLSNACPVDECQ